MRRFLSWTALAVAVAFAACAPARQTPTDHATEKEPYDVKSEGTIPPPAEDVKPEVDVEESAVEEAPLVVDEGAVRIDSTRVKSATVDGFRVQVFASIDGAAAESTRARAEKRVGLPAYIQLIDRMYKVRVGDCVTREQAEEVLKRVKAVYPDAWIVASPVIPPPEKDAQEMH